MSQLPPPIPPTPPQYHELLPPPAPGAPGAWLAPHRGGTVLGLGIASLGVMVLHATGLLFKGCCCTSWVLSLGLAIGAWVMANGDLRAMNERRMDPFGRSSTQAGKVCAIIAVVLHLLELLAIVGALLLGVAVLGAFAAGAAGSNP